VAAQQPPKAKPSAANGAVRANRVECEFRAGRCEPTRTTWPEQDILHRRKNHPVKPDQQHDEMLSEIHPTVQRGKQAPRQTATVQLF
jgi:hypothetical protein